MALDNNSTISAGSSLKYLFPHVSSTINANESTYQEGSGSQKLLVAYTSDKGEDNVIQHFTNDDEFIAKTGNPNLKLHGQAAYNVVNWLQSGGEVYGLRVMPDDAGYAHAFLNILTKIESKNVLDKDGKLATMPNVILKPAIAYTNVNNTSVDLLAYELSKDRSNEITIDGFENHMLFTVFPTGRGSSYNNLGFRLSLNATFDDTYDFRVYNLEVIKFDEFDTANIVEGPFYVSLSPDALSSNNESMFIEDVVNKYSTNLRMIFNEEAFARLAYKINPHVNPMKLDLLSGISRVSGDEIDGFYSTVTQKFEDTHITLQRYDAAGSPLTDSEGNTLLNIVDTSNLIEQSILIADNTYRQKIYQRYQQQIEDMKEIFNGFSNNNFPTLVEKLLVTEDGITQTGGELTAMSLNLVTYKQNIENLVNVFNTSLLDSDFNRIVNENILVEQAVNQTLGMISKLVAYNKSIESNSSILDVEELLNATYNKLNLKEIIDIKAVSKKDDANNLSNTIVGLKASGDANAQVEALVEILTDTKALIDYLSLVVTENDLSTTQLNVIVDTYNFVIDRFNALHDPFLSDKAIQDLLVIIFQELDALVASIYMQISLVIVNLDLIIIDDIISDKIADLISRLTAITYVNTRLYEEKVVTTEGRNILMASVRSNIENTSAITAVMKSIVYTTQLQDFNSPVRFLNGNDGSLSVDNEKLRYKTMTQLLAKAYTGLIDESITDRKQTPYQYILDANYPIDVKNSIVTLTRDIRKDVFYYADTGFKSSQQSTVEWRTSEFSAMTQFMGIYGQDFVVYDMFNGRDIRVTATYFISKMLPSHADTYGMQYPMAGNTRGIVDGFKAISFIPNNAYKDQFYRKQINYVESDPKRTRFGSQLTASTKNTPLSNINNVLTALDIKRNVEDMAEDYQFEFEDDETIRTFEYNLNTYLESYITSRSVAEISASVYASDYDKQQGILRVLISVKFHGVIERIVISIDVVK